MDRVTLSRIDEELESSEVASLCFLCHDVVNRKRLEGVMDAKALFLRLEERGLLDNQTFLSQLLHTIGRIDLLSLLETDGMQPVETDANPMLSEYRVMLYHVYQDMTEENLDKMKFLLISKLGRRQIEACTRDIRISQRRPQPAVTEMQPSDARPTVCTDAEPNTMSHFDQTEYYALTHNPRGQCVVFNNEKFMNVTLKDREGTQQDEKALRKVFTDLGFTVVVHNNLTAGDIRYKINELGKRNFLNDDVLVVCVLSHGEKGCIYGTDEKPVDLRELTKAFTSGRAPTLAGKPKLFFIQACQGSNYQAGSVPCPPRPSQEKEHRESRLEEDAGPVRGETIPSDADFLLGMATVQECKSFRNTSKGSIYIQQLCDQLMKSAQSPVDDDILTVLTRVNREVSKGEYLNHKQMPEPKYTLTKKLVFKCVKCPGQTTLHGTTTATARCMGLRAGITHHPLHMASLPTVVPSPLLPTPLVQMPLCIQASQQAILLVPYQGHPQPGGPPGGGYPNPPPMPPVMPPTIPSDVLSSGDGFAASWQRLGQFEHSACLHQKGVFDFGISAPCHHGHCGRIHICPTCPNLCAEKPSYLLGIIWCVHCHPLGAGVLQGPPEEVPMERHSAVHLYFGSVLHDWIHFQVEETHTVHAVVREPQSFSL
ncbi:Caspase-8 [Larimichthys crocea]|uniref:Uncharacterized protein n=1 Tax=Larimichthys crocea TaxID=215358 RepID=A0ACD3QT44_LARCR|nr:Caspase-8 [Larimichthys crocea]